MKAILIFFSLSFFTFLTAYPQFKTLAEGPLFEEPEDGQVKIMQLSNGNTLFIHFAIKRHFSISYTLYDSTHKIVKQNSFKLNRPDNQTWLGGAVETDNDVVLKLYTYVKWVTHNMRFVIDKANGEVKAMDNKPEIMTPLPGLRAGKGFLSEVEENYATIIVNPANNLYTTFRRKPSALSVSILNNDYITTQEKQFLLPSSIGKIHEIKKCIWLDKSRFCLLLNTFNTGRKVERENNRLFLILGNFDNNTATTTELDFLNDRTVAHSDFEVNPFSNQILILTTIEEGKKEKNNVCYLSAFSIVENKLLYSKKLYPEIIGKSISEFGKEVGEINTPSDFFVNKKDGTFQVVFEKYGIVDNYRESSGRSYQTSTNTFLGNLAVISYDKNGNETGSCIVPKSHYIFFIQASPFGGTALGEGFKEVNDGNQFKGHTYFNGSGKAYVFVNDIPKNAESAKKGKLTNIKGVAECVAYYYDVTQNGILTERKFFFDSRAGNDNLALFSGSSYDEKRNVFVTMKVHPEEKGARARLVWLQPQ